MQKVVFFILACLVVVSCKKERKLEGHWVSTGYFKNQRFHTLDFDDSIAFMDENFFSGHPILQFYKKDNPYELANVSSHDVEVYLLYDEIDTIRLWTESGYLGGDTLKFVRVNQSESYMAEVFNMLDLEVILRQYSTEGLLDIRDRSYLNAFIAIGKLKDDFGEREVGSLAIQVDDVFLEVYELPQWVRRRKDLLTERERDKITFILMKDISVTKTLEADILQAIRADGDSVRIVEALVDPKTNRIVFTRIN